MNTDDNNTSLSFHLSRFRVLTIVYNKANVYIHTHTYRRPIKKNCIEVLNAKQTEFRFSLALLFAANFSFNGQMQIHNSHNMEDNDEEQLRHLKLQQYFFTNLSPK